MATKPPGQVYVAQGKNGLFKVGYAVRPQERLKRLKKEFLARGDELERIEFCAPTFRPLCVESTVVDHCKKTLPRHSGFEWFNYGCFDSVKAIADAETERCKGYPPLELRTPEERAESRAQYLAHRESRAAQRVVDRAAHQEWMAKRRLQSRRHRPARVFHAIVAAVAGAAEVRHG